MSPHCNRYPAPPVLSEYFVTFLDDLSYFQHPVFRFSGRSELVSIFIKSCFYPVKVLPPPPVGALRSATVPAEGFGRQCNGFAVCIGASDDGRNGVAGSGIGQDHGCD